MTLADLHLFLDIARSGSLAAAARAHGLDPSAVSRRLAALEAALGARLFDRTTRRLVLTDAGQTVLDAAPAPLAELHALRERLHDGASRPRGRLRLTASIAFAERWLVPRLARFRALHPDITYDLVLSDAPVDLMAESIDLALRLGPEPYGPWRAHKVIETAYRVVASPAFLDAHPIRTPETLSHAPCIAFPFPGYRSRWVLTAPNGTDIDVPVSPAFTVSNALAIRAAALNGLGPALLPDWLTEEDRAQGLLHDLFPGHAARASDDRTAAWLLVPIRPYVPARSRAFADWIATAV